MKLMMAWRDTAIQFRQITISVVDMYMKAQLFVSLHLIVFTATISHSVFLRVGLDRRALQTMPDCPAIITVKCQALHKLENTASNWKHLHTLFYLVQSRQANEDCLCEKSFLLGSLVDIQQLLHLAALWPLRKQEINLEVNIQTKLSIVTWYYF